MINNVVVKGVLGKDPELAVTKTGKEVAHFSIAIKLRNKDYPLWYNIEAWGYLATKVRDSLHKGSPVIISGSLSLNKYNGVDGQAREVHQIIADNIELVEKSTSPTPTTVPFKVTTSTIGTSSAYPQEQNKETPPTIDINSDDLPF